MKFCGPGRLKRLASWTRRPSEQSGTWRLSDDGNVVKRSCRGCDDTNEKCIHLMERCAFEYQLRLGCRLLLQVQVKSKVASTCQLFVSCKRCIFVRGGSKSEHCTAYLHFYNEYMCPMSSDSTLPHSERKLWRPISCQILFSASEIWSASTWLQSFWFLKNPRSYSMEDNELSSHSPPH